MPAVRDNLIAAGVKNLREFGYPAVTKDNILTDAVYSAFFRKMLEGTLEQSELPSLKAAIRELMAELPQE